MRILLSLLMIGLLTACNDSPEPVEPVGNSQLHVYPNPALSSIAFSVFNNSNSVYHIEVVNPEGKIIFETPVEPAEDMQTFRINLENERAGYFFVKLHTGTQTIIRKILRL